MMQFRKTLWIHLLVLATAFLCVTAVHRASADEVLIVKNAETAVLDPADWDRVIANERYFDALRAMLVRFPGAAEDIHAKLLEGNEIKKVELVLDWERQEGARPERGRHGWGANELYENRPGKWSVIAYALRRPWSLENPDLGPTFNAHLRRASFWTRGGGRDDDEDRHAQRFGPLPLHAENPRAILDLTPLLTDKTYGENIGRRLRNLEERGVQLHKNELYDMSYRNFYAYDWSVSTGYMRLWVHEPELRIHLTKADAPTAEALPAPADLTALAQRLQAEGKGDRPPMSFPEDLAERTQHLLARPANIPDWQWARIQELRALHTDPADSGLSLGRGFNFASLFANDPKIYMDSMQNLMRMPPRTWQGHLSSDFALLAAGFNELLAPAAQDHLALYWKAWLHPETEGALDADLGGGTHRGGPTYFRGYTRSMGTMNFVHNANMGALLGGQYLDAPYVLANARYGIEHLLLRTYAFGNGAHQEIGDTYYQALTVAGAGAIAKYAEDPYDRLMGKIVRDRLLEPLISMYHPGLRRMTHPMGRGSFTYHLLLQEGPYHVLHSLSPQGTLIHLDDLTPQRTRTPHTWGQIHGLSILGDEGSPQRIGLLAPWVEPYMAEPVAGVVDRKPLPWRVFARDSSPGCRPNGWHVNYLGRNVALASRDNANHDYGVTSVIAQWRRDPEQVTAMDDMSTLLLSMGSNGRYPRQGASMAEFGIVQLDNKLVALKALPDPARNVFGKEKDDVRALHASAAILAHGDVAEREIWINDRRIDSLSGNRADPGGKWQDRMNNEGEVVYAADGDLITIHDGVSYIGLIPITVNALERDQQVEIAYEYPTIMINVHIYRGGQPLDLDRLYETDAPPSAGFVLEVADAEDFESFSDFQEHMRKAALDCRWDKQEKLAHLSYRSGDDLLEMGYNPLIYPAVYRRVNGAWPYLSEGVERESNWAIQSRVGQIEKHGAVLQTEPGREAYLLTIPESNTFVGYNPLPDPTLWTLTVPGGRRLQADARLGLARVAVRPDANQIWVDYAVKPDQTAPDMATALLAFGWPQQPVLELNGTLHDQPLRTVEIDGQTAYVIPLNDHAERGVVERFRRFAGHLTATRGTHLMDWHVVGPFGSDFSESHAPEQSVDLTAAYDGLDGTKVQWKRTVADQAAARGLGGVDLQEIFQQNQRASAYAFTRIHSESKQTVTLFFGSPTDAAIWINGKPVFHRQDYYRVFYPDQDRMSIELQQGENQVLLRIGRSWEGWTFSFRLADEYGMPLPEGVAYITADGAVAAGAQP